MTATTPGSLPLLDGSGTANAVYALLTDAYEDGTLIDVINDHTAEAREAGRAAGYDDGYAHGRREGSEEVESSAYAKGYDDGAARGHDDVVEALEDLLDKRRDKK